MVQPGSPAAAREAVARGLEKWMDDCAAVQRTVTCAQMQTGISHAGVGMNGDNGYAVFFFEQALEALGEPIKPYLHPGPPEPHVMCQRIDTAGALVQMTLLGKTGAGREVELELMVPMSMVRMVVSAHSDDSIGFGTAATALAAAAGTRAVSTPVGQDAQAKTHPDASSGATR